MEKLNFELGVKSLKQEDFSKAIQYFGLVLKENPDNIEAHYNIAVAYKKQGNHKHSLRHFDKVVKLLNSPSEGKPDLMTFSKPARKTVFKDDGNNFDVYNKVKEKEHDYLDLGDMHADNNRQNAAIEYYNLALKVNPYNDTTYFKIGKSYMKLNDPLNAEPYIKKAIELNPGNLRYEYYKNKVLSRIAEKYGDGAGRKEEIVIKNLEDDRTLSEFEQKNYEKELYEGDWATKDPNTEISIIDQALKQSEKNNQTDQKAKIEEYYQDKDKKELLYGLSQEKYGDFSYKQSQELDYLDLGDLHFDNQEYETAVEYYKMALNINPNNDYTYYKLSRSYIEQGNYAKADEYIEKALTLSEENRKYVYFKNRITDKLTRRQTPEQDEFYSPQQEFTVENGERIEEIAKEPAGNLPGEDSSVLDRLKSIVSSIKLPDMPDLPNFDINFSAISKLPGKIISPLEGKVEKFSKKQEKKPDKKKEEKLFNRPADYYEAKEKQPTDKVAEQKPEENMPVETQKQEKEKEKTYTASYYNHKGVEFFKKEDLDKAEDFFKKAVQIRPMSAKAYNNLANVEVKRENYKKAEKYAHKSVEVDPEFPEGYYNLAIIHKKQRNFHKEIHYLNKAVSVDPKYYEAYFARGLAHYKMGDYEKAKADFKEVLKYKNDHFLASQNLGIIYANELDYNQAEKYLNLAVTLNNENPQAYFHLGVVRKNAGKIDSAIKTFEKTISLNPSNYKAYIMLSKCYDEDSQPEKALNALKSAAEKNPENAEIYNYIGLLNLKFDDYEKACKSFKKAVEKNSKRAIYHYNLSQCYLTMGKREQSNFEFQRAVSQIPSSVQDYTDLAEIFFDRGMASYSIRVLKQGISNLHKSDYLFLTLSDFYERTGAVKAARNVLEEYLKENTSQSAFNLLIQKRLNRLDRL